MLGMAITELGTQAGLGLGGGILALIASRFISRYGERIAVLETHIPHIAKTLDAIDRRLENIEKRP